MSIITVDIDEYIKSEAPHKLDSGGVGPCIVIGAMYENKGYMIQAVPYKSFATDINPLFLDLRADAKRIDDLEIHIIGGQIDFDEETPGDILSARQATLEKIAEYGFLAAVRRVIWGRAHFYQSLLLDLSNKTALYDESKTNDYDITP
jgi:hypothetical protein